MQHRHEWDATPAIGSSARIIRGFSRIGIGAAVLIAVLGLAVAVSVAFNDYKYATQWVGFPLAKSDLPDAPWLEYQREPVVKPPPKPGMFDDLIPAPKGRLLTDAEVGLTPQKSDSVIKPIGNSANEFDPEAYLAFKRREDLKSAMPLLHAHRSSVARQHAMLHALRFWARAWNTSAICTP
jgi:hypothetical protein